MSGAPIGRLHGVPATIKDLQITKDMPTQHGSKIFAGHQPTKMRRLLAVARRRCDHPRQDHRI
ncbi:amidase family protein [Mesorhizobium sp. M0046]